LALAFILCAAPCVAADSPLAFSTTGGEAWTFRKQIELSVTEARCDQVTITSPLSTFVAWPQGGQVAAQIQLAPGDNRVAAECRKDGVVSGAAEQNWYVRLRDIPKAWVHAFVGDSGIVLDARLSERAKARPRPIMRYQWRERAGNPAALAGLPVQGRKLVLPTPAIDGEYSVTLRVTDTAGRSDESTLTFRVHNGYPQLIDLGREHSAWIDQAVIYGVVPSLFGPRNLADVTAHLDRLAALGVDTLWLSPITTSPPGDFGYAVTDHFRLRESFGSEADLRELIRSAHARGLKAIIDFVPNHLSDQHAYFIDYAARAAASPYSGFFEIAPTGGVASYFDWRNLKNLNYDNPEVQRLVIEAFAYWVSEFDIDGFRVDVAWGPRERAPAFWPRWRRELKRIKPDLLLLAEASARDPYYGRHGFDAAYDWTEKLGEWAWHGAFQDETATASRLRSEIERSASDALVFRFLGNNDTGARFVTRYGVARTRVAATMLFTLPGIPGLYTGDETGAAYEPYRENPPLSWDDDHGLQSWYTRLITLRRDHAALRSRTIRWIDMPSFDQVLAYVRPGANAKDDIVVLLNYSAEPVRLVLPDDAIRVSPGQDYIDLLHGDGLTFDGTKPVITLAGHGVRILKAK
jgi:cyclomaltodextrinase